MKNIKSIDRETVEIDGIIYRKEQNDFAVFYSPYETNDDNVSYCFNNNEYSGFKTIEYAEKVAFQQMVRRKFDNFIRLNGWNPEKQGHRLFLSRNGIVWGCRTHRSGGFEWTCNKNQNHGFDKIMEYMGEYLIKFFELEEI